MILQAVDWAFVILFFVFSLAIGMAVSKRAGSSWPETAAYLQNFFYQAGTCRGGCWEFQW